MKKYIKYYLGYYTWLKFYDHPHAIREVYQSILFDIKYNRFKSRIKSYNYIMGIDN